jgi:hypothetical protein
MVADRPGSSRGIELAATRATMVASLLWSSTGASVTGSSMIESGIA